MGIQSSINPPSQAGRLLAQVFLLLSLLTGVAWAQGATPLLLPSGLAYDSQGNLYFSEMGNQVVRKLTPGGSLTIVAGTGTQGSAGDGAAARSAQLDSPGALAVDAAGNLFIADTHNHRIRRVNGATGTITTWVGTGNPGLGAEALNAAATPIDLPSALAFTSVGDLLFADFRAQVVRRVDHVTGLVSTVAGNGLQGSQGDGGQARAASLDGPAGLALDAAGDLFISDSHSQRVRRIDAATGIITTVAGGASANAVPLRLPRGLAIDAVGALYVVDAGNHRLRRVDPATGQITTIAGGTTEGFGGDEAPAPLARLDGPRGLALSPTGLPTFADSENGRVRQVDAAGVLHTIAGAGALPPAGLVLTGPGTSVYGAGSATATLGGPAGAGQITLLEGANIVGSATLSGGAASISLAGLPAGIHTLTASFAGDATHGPLLSNALIDTVTAAPVVATPDGATQVYGLGLPVLSGTVSGILPRDAALVQATFSSSATPLSGAGSYPVRAVLSGAAAANYALTTAPASITITKAPSTLSLTNALLAHVGTTTTGQPGGPVTLFDGSAAYATVSVSTGGDAQFSPAGLTNGSHTLSAGYAGDANFLASSAPPQIVSIGQQAGADFSLATTGPPGLTVSAGTGAVFSFTETPINGGLSSPVLLAAAGLPAGATATFSPSYLPPGNGSVNFTMTVQTLKTASLAWPGTLMLAGLVGLLLLPRRRRAAWAGVLVLGLAGCGDRVNNAGQGAAQSRTYNITVNGTATSNAGTTLVHSVALTLTVQ